MKQQENSKCNTEIKGGWIVEVTSIHSRSEVCGFGPSLSFYSDTIILM